MNKNKRKPKKTAVVIGATGNLGQAIVKALKKDGYEVDLTWIRKDRPDATLASSYKNLPEVIDLAVYVPGINLVKPIHEISEENWDEVMDVNLRGAFLFAKYAFAGLKKAQGDLITISSINARYPYPNRSAYAASKGALESLTRQLALEWAPYNISTLSIRLGPLTKLMGTTKIGPEQLEATKKRLLQHELIPPEAVAEYIAAISKGGLVRWMTGSVADFDAGFTLNAFPLEYKVE